MWINVVSLAISLIAVFQLPTAVSLGTDLAIYSSLVWYQYCLKEVSTANGIIWCSFAILSFFYYGLGWHDVLPLTGMVIYLVFALQYGWLLVKQFRSVAQRRINLVYLAISLLATVLSVLLRPDPSYIYLPLGVFFLGVLGRSRVQRLLAGSAPDRPCPGIAKET